jgi:hypothetical protein
VCVAIKMAPSPTTRGTASSPPLPRSELHPGVNQPDGRGRRLHGTARRLGPKTENGRSRAWNSTWSRRSSQHRGPNQEGPGRAGAFFVRWGGPSGPPHRHD